MKSILLCCRYVDTHTIYIYPYIRRILIHPSAHVSTKKTNFTESNNHRISLKTQGIPGHHLPCGLACLAYTMKLCPSSTSGPWIQLRLSESMKPTSLRWSQQLRGIHTPEINNPSGMKKKGTGSWLWWLWPGQRLLRKTIEKAMPQYHHAING